MAYVNVQQRTEKEYLIAYTTLVQVAMHKGYIEYGQLGAILGIKPSPGFSGWIGGILGDINRQEIACGRPLLSSVAVNKDTWEPNEHYFEFARAEGFSVGDSDESEKAFWNEQLEEVYEVWRLPNQQETQKKFC